jgi:hypothetical protein
MIDKGLIRTSDIGAAAYCRTVGKHVDVKVSGQKGIFEIEVEGDKDEIAEYFDGKGDFINFANNQRNLKSQVHNLKGVQDGQRPRK